MRKVVFLILCLGFGNLKAQEPILLEVFTYDGCSHCMMANRALRNLEVDSTLNRTVVVLTHHVDYEKEDGFQDSLDHPFSRMRQKELVQKGICSGIFTPQAALNGSFCFAISGRKQLIDQINAFPVDTAMTRFEVRWKKANSGFLLEVDLSNYADSSWQINLALLQMQRVVSPHSGDNVGATLVHANCLLEAMRFDYRKRFTESFRLPEFVLSNPDKYAAIFYLQHTQSGEVRQVQVIPLTQIAQ